MLHVRATTKEDLSHQETGEPPSNVTKMLHPDLVEQIAKAFERELGVSQPENIASEKWDTLRDTIHRTAFTIF